MSSKDAAKTVFRTPIGNFYYTVMPFGLKNSRATYQRAMTAIFHDIMHKKIEFEIIVITPITLRGQAIADLLSNFPGENNWNITDDVPDELPEIALMETAGAVWTLHFDGSSTTSEGGARRVLSKDIGEIVAMSFELDFPCTNNMAEYEAYLTSLVVAREMGIKHL